MYEYKVIPAPTKGQKKRGVKGPSARFANALENTMNALAADGWEYQRTDTLPSEERQGLTSTQTVYRCVLVFRRLADVQAAEPELEETTADDPNEMLEDDEVETDLPEEEELEEFEDYDEPEVEKA